MDELGDWLSSKEAAKLAGYSLNHIRRLIYAKKIVARKWGNAWMVGRLSLLEYLEQVKALGERRGPKKAS